MRPTRISWHSARSTALCQTDGARRRSPRARRSARSAAIHALGVDRLHAELASNALRTRSCAGAARSVASTRKSSAVIASALAPSMRGGVAHLEAAHFANSALWIVQCDRRGGEHRVDRRHALAHVAHVGAALDAWRQLVEREERRARADSALAAERARERLVVADVEIVGGAPARARARRRSPRRPRGSSPRRAASAPRAPAAWRART